MKTVTSTPPPAHGAAGHMPRFLRVSDILELASISRATWYNYVRKGLAPPGKLISPGVRVWPREQVLALFE